MKDWRKVKEAIRNYVFNNFNPGLLPDNNSLRQEIFEKISSTAGLSLALEPQVFVSRIRCRIFRTWKSAEDYYANSLRELQRTFRDSATSTVEPDDDDDVLETCSEDPIQLPGGDTPQEVGG